MHYIIGDLHANVEELKKILKLLNLTINDSLVFLGDYIDKNPNTEEILQIIYDLDKKYKCVFIKGNHEYVWDNYLNHKELKYNDFLLGYGGVEALSGLSDRPYDLLKNNEVEIIKPLLKSYLDLISKTVDYYVVGNFIALHGGLLENQLDQLPIKFTELNYFIRPNKINMDRKYKNQHTCVCGHTYLQDDPTIKSGYINIDLGAGLGKYLGALSVEDKKIIRSDGKIYNLNK